MAINPIYGFSPVYSFCSFLVAFLMKIILISVPLFCQYALARSEGGTTALEQTGFFLPKLLIFSQIIAKFSLDNKAAIRYLNPSHFYDNFIYSPRSPESSRSITS